jgi:branched-chain amino acid transport system substrate-binding protein
VAVAALVALAATGCGSSLNDQEMLRANSEAFRLDGAAASAVGPQDSQPTGDEAAAATGDSGAAAVAPGGSGPVTGSGDSGSAPAAGSGSAAGGTGASGVRSPGVSGTGGSGTKQPAGAQSATGSGAAAPTPGGSSGPSVTPAAGGPRSEFRLGSIGQQSGPIGSAFIPMIHAAKAWVADVNTRGGLAGHPVRLSFGDDGGDPSRSLALAKRMVEQDKVVALFGGQMALTLQAITPYLEERKVPFIHNTPSAPDTDKSPMVFNSTTGSTDGTQWAHIAGLTKFNSDKKKAAILYCREAQTCPLLAEGAKKFAQQAGLQVVNEAQVSLAQPDYTAEVIAARNAGAEMLIPVLENASVVRLIRSAKRQGWSPAISSQMAMHDQRFIMLGGADTEGVVMGSEVPWATSPHPIMAQYRAAIDRYIPGGIKASLGAAVFVDGRLLELIAAGFGPEPTSADILNGLWALKGETLGGLLPPITFAREGGHAQTNPCVIPAIVKGGQFFEGTEWVCPPGYQRPG